MSCQVFFLNVAHLSRLTSHGTKWWCRADGAIHLQMAPLSWFLGPCFLPTSIRKNSEASTSALFWYPAAWTLGRNLWIWLRSGTGPHSKGVPGTPNNHFINGCDNWMVPKSLQRKWLFNQTFLKTSCPGGNKPLGKPIRSLSGVTYPSGCRDSHRGGAETVGG